MFTPEPGSILKDCNSLQAREYKITDTLGKGGMGCVYKAVDLRTEEVVALKVLLPTIKDPSIPRLFEEERRVLAALFQDASERVPYIVEYKDGGVWQHCQLFLVMEYIRGVSLQRYIYRRFREKRRGFTDQEIFSVVDCMAKGLSHAHRHSIYHRDLKPANVLINVEFKAYLLDFGLSKLLSTPNLLPPGTIVGTPFYMSPEQALGQEVDHLSDIYSFGLIIYEMLTGTLPCLGKNPMQVARDRARVDLPPPSSIKGSLRPIDPEVDQIVMRCIARKKENRFQLASDIALSFRRFVEQKQVNKTQDVGASAPESWMSHQAKEAQKAGSNALRSTVPQLSIPRKAATVQVILDKLGRSLESSVTRFKPLDHPYSSTIERVSVQDETKYESFVGATRRSSQETATFKVTYRNQAVLVIKFTAILLKGKLDARYAFLEGDPPKNAQTFELDLSSYESYDNVRLPKAFIAVFEQFIAWCTE